MTNNQWAAIVSIAVIVIGVLVLVAVGLSQPNSQERLINELEAHNIPIENERSLMAVIDDACPLINGSYKPVYNLESLGMSETEALDTLAIVRYSGYCS